MHINDIPKITKRGNYQVDIPLSHLIENSYRYISKYGLQLNPDFQRGYKWGNKRRSKFVEFLLKGGETTPIYLNHPGWMNDFIGDFVVVDGLQRLTSCLFFLLNKLPVFGYYRYEIEDMKVLLDRISIAININNLKTRKEVLQWYLDLNDGGVKHTEKELNKVKQLIKCS